MKTGTVANDLFAASVYLAQFPRENIYALSHLFEGSLSPGTFAYLYKDTEELTGTQIVLSDGRWFPFFTRASAIAPMVQQVSRHHPRWIGAMQSITDPLLQKLSTTTPLDILYREDDYACELDISRFVAPDTQPTRKATMADLYAVAELRRAFEAEYFGTRPQLLAGDWAVRLAARYIERGTWLGFSGNQIVAMTVTEARISGFTHLGAVYTMPEYRGLGMAHNTVAALCAARLEEGDRITLHVKKDNTPALQVYKSLGFAPWGDYTMCSFRC